MGWRWDVLGGMCSVSFVCICIILLLSFFGISFSSFLPSFLSSFSSFSSFFPSFLISFLYFLSFLFSLSSICPSFLSLFPLPSFFSSFFSLLSFPFFLLFPSFFLFLPHISVIFLLSLSPSFCDFLSLPFLSPFILNLSPPPLPIIYNIPLFWFITFIYFTFLYVCVQLWRLWFLSSLMFICFIYIYIFFFLILSLIYENLHRDRIIYI